MNTASRYLVSGLLCTLAACSADLVEPGHPAGQIPSGLDAVAIRLQIDLEHGRVDVIPPGASSSPGTGPSFALLGTNEVTATASNLARSAPANNKVQVTFDVALTNRLTSASLIPSTFPGTTGGSGLLMIPFKVTQVAGGTVSQVATSVEWNGDGSAGSGAPRNFFNDFGCPTSGATSDCFRWEQFPAPLGPGETTLPQKVGFTVNKTVQSFQVLLILAADVYSDLPAVARIAVTPPSYTMADGFPASFSAVAYDQVNNPLPWATIRWTSPDLTAVEFQYGSALVGTITGPSVVVHGRKVGLTSFTVSSGGVSVVVPLDIQVNTIVLVQAYAPDSSITAGDQVQAVASVKDNSGNIVPNFPPTWSTSDPNVATVDASTGLVTAVGAGQCDIIATAAAASGSFPLTVLPAFGTVQGNLVASDGRSLNKVLVTLNLGPSIQANPESYFEFLAVPVGSGGGQLDISNLPTDCLNPGTVGYSGLTNGGIATVNIPIVCATSTLLVHLAATDLRELDGVRVSLTPGQITGITVGSLIVFTNVPAPMESVQIDLSNLPADCLNPGPLIIGLSNYIGSYDGLVWSITCGP